MCNGSGWISNIAFLLLFVTIFHRLNQADLSPFVLSYVCCRIESIKQMQSHKKSKMTKISPSDVFLLCSNCGEAQLLLHAFAFAYSIKKNTYQSSIANARLCNAIFKVKETSPHISNQTISKCVRCSFSSNVQVKKPSFHLPRPIPKNMVNLFYSVDEKNLQEHTLNPPAENIPKLSRKEGLTSMRKHLEEHCTISPQPW